MTTRLLVVLALVVGLAAPHAQQSSTPTPPPGATGQPLPRFRGGANLVRVDAYVTRDGIPVTDLAAEDFEIVEDSAVQRVESFEVIRPRGPVPQALRVEPNTVAEARAMAMDPAARLFVLFMDVWHVHQAGSFRAQGPITRMLDRAIGQDDMVGVMTPDMSARNLTLARRTGTIDDILRNNWFWGERDRLNSSDPRERDIEMCYPEAQAGTTGIAREMIERRRERRTLDAIDDLIVHLQGIRDERKFVVMLSEGWTLPGRNDALSRTIRDNVPGAEPIGVTPEGRLTTKDPRRTNESFDWCERERLRLASDDLQSDFRFLLQRANRANVSFYAIDPRGLVAFDQDIGPRRPLTPVADANRLNLRQTALRELAETTDGFAVLNTNNMDRALERIVQDVGAYYLLGYYSTNTRLDGRYRKITVRVKQPDLQVRARPGYLAPTEADAASARVDALMNGAPAGHSTLPPGLARALERLAPARGVAHVRVQATGGAGQIWITAELDAATLKLPEWEKGGIARMTVEHERGSAAPIEVALPMPPGQRTIAVTQPQAGSLAPGRYVIRLQFTPEGSTVPIQTTADVVVPVAGGLLSQTGIASRRGPSTGLQYLPTADARFRRTERIRLEIPRLTAEGIVSARLLSRDGSPLPLVVAVSERVEQQARLIVADLTLAPLAQGEYVIEVALDHMGKQETATYGFRLIP
jgi:VWFA-related protein